MKTKNYNKIKVGITFSNFGLFHEWLVKMVEEAKLQFDYFILGLQLDPAFRTSRKTAPQQV